MPADYMPGQALFPSNADRVSVPPLPGTIMPADYRPDQALFPSNADIVSVPSLPGTNKLPDYRPCQALFPSNADIVSIPTVPETTMQPDYKNCNTFHHYTQEKLPLSTKRKRLMDDMADHYTQEEKIPPPTKRMCLKDDMVVNSDFTYAGPEYKHNTEFRMQDIMYDPVIDSLQISHQNAKSIPSETGNGPIEDQSSNQQPFIGIAVIQPDGSQTSLWDWQCRQQLKQEDQSIEHLTTFNPNSTFAGKGVPTQRRGRRGNSTCNVCNKTFMGRQKLKLHMNSHTGERPFVCNICNKSFTRGTNLTQHRRVHFDGSYPCPDCAKAFRTPADRLVHALTRTCTRIHLHLQQTVDGWQCLTCHAKNLVTKQQAERHARIHERGKGMQCPVCEQGFQGEKPNVLVSHVKKQHPDYISSLGL